MAVKIRLMRTGKKKQPAYRVVVADARSPRNGRFIEILGHYKPREEPSVFVIDEDKAISWLAKGAQPTEQVSKLLDATGVWDRFESQTGRKPKAKFVVSQVALRKEKKVAEPPAPAPAAEPAPVAEAAAVVEAPAEEAAAAEDVPAVDEASAADESPADESAADEAAAEEPA